MKPLSEADLEKKFKKKKIFDLFIENYLGFLINKGNLAEFYCSILFNCKRSSDKHYDLIKNKIKYEVKNRKRSFKDPYFKDIQGFIKGEKIPKNFSVNINESDEPVFDYLWYVYLSSKNELLAILQYNVKDLIFTGTKYHNKKRISFKNATKNKKFVIKYLSNKISKQKKSN